jgi:hypothetical protein
MERTKKDADEGESKVMRTLLLIQLLSLCSNLHKRRYPSGFKEINFVKCNNSLIQNRLHHSSPFIPSVSLSFCVTVSFPAVLLIFFALFFEPVFPYSSR